MNKKTNLINSFRFAFEGIFFVIKNNRNMRIHIVIALLVVLFGIYFKISFFEMGLALIMIVLVIITEMLNTVVEETINMITKDYKIEAKIAKDVSAGSVLVTSFAAVIVGLFIFLPHLSILLRK